MRWQNLGRSDNVEDRRGQGGMGGMRRLGGLPVGGKFGAVLLVVVLVAGYYGYDLSPLLGLGGTEVSQTRPVPRNDELAQFTSAALKSTEDTWSQIFRQAGRQYSPATLVLYSGYTDTACGYGQSAMGPFYCPADHKVYIDLSFYNDMERKMGNRMRERGILEGGDLEEALNTATAIGDDRLQRQSMGRVVPDSFTHGTSEQRYNWFKRGYDTGDVAQCNTFNGV